MLRLRIAPKNKKLDAPPPVIPERTLTQRMFDEQFRWPDVQGLRRSEGRAIDRLYRRAWEFYNMGNYEVAADLFDAGEELKQRQLDEINEKGT